MRTDPSFSRNAPHIRYQEGARAVMGDVILPMAVIYAMCYYYYGVRVILLMLVSVVSALAADALCTVIAGKRPNIRDYSAIVTGMIIPLMMPASIPFSVPVIAAVFGIAVAKHPFGGAGKNIFNPAAAGLAFAVICFPARMFAYPLSRAPLPVFPDSSLLQAAAPAFTLKLGGVPQYDFVEMSLGNYPGPMGATNILVILACLLYLIFRGTVSWQAPAAYLAVFASLCFIFPRAGLDGARTALYEVMSGTVLFGGVFMLADPATTPQRVLAKAVYSAAAAALLFILRRGSAALEEFVFVLLIMNASVWGFDLLAERAAGFIRRNRLEDTKNKKIQKNT